MYICIVNSQDTLLCWVHLTVPEADALLETFYFSGFSITPRSSSSHNSIAFLRNPVFVSRKSWSEWLSAFVQDCDDTRGLFTVCFNAECWHAESLVPRYYVQYSRTFVMSDIKNKKRLLTAVTFQCVPPPRCEKW